METVTQTPPVETPVEPAVETVPVTAGEGEGEQPDVAVSVDGVEAEVTDTKGSLELTPATGVVGVLVLALLAVAVVKLRKK